MRYIADANGYVKEVSFGADIVCGGKNCTEYTGAVPSGYASLEAWYIAEADKLYRWKISSGKLTLVNSATAPVASALPSFIKIVKDGDTTDYSTSYQYFDPFRTTNVNYIIGSAFTYGARTFATYGDRSNYDVAGVYAGQGIKSVRLDCSVRYTNNTDSKVAISTTLNRVRDGSVTALASVSDHMTSSGRLTHTLATITAVQEGDFFYLSSYKGYVAHDIDVIGSNSSTQMCIEAIR